MLHPIDACLQALASIGGAAAVTTTTVSSGLAAVGAASGLEI